MLNPVAIGQLLIMPSTSLDAAAGSSSAAASSSPTQAATSNGTANTATIGTSSTFNNIQAHDDGDESDDEDDDDEQAWADEDDDEEEEMTKQPTKALFSVEVLESPEAALEHAKEKHGIDIIDFIAKNRKCAYWLRRLHLHS